MTVSHCEHRRRLPGTIGEVDGRSVPPVDGEQGLDGCPVAGRCGVVQRRVAETVAAVDVIVERRQQDDEQLGATEETGVVNGSQTETVGDSRRRRAALEEDARKTDGPAVVVDEGTVDESRSAVDVACVDVGAKSHEDPNLFEVSFAYC